MNTYELAVLFDPQLEVDLTKGTNKVEGLVKDNGGKIVKTDNWGKKKLAYPIQKHETAVYVFYGVELPAENIAKLESTLNITDEVIRYLIVKPDLKAQAKAEADRAAKAKKAAERGDSDKVEEEEGDQDG